MKQFDMTRFCRVLKLDFVEGCKAMMWGTLCMLLLYLFFFWFAHEIGFHNSRFDYINDPAEALRRRISVICEAVGAFSAMAMYIFFLITASTLYRVEQKKQQRIAWLMLPATNLEKFVSRWIYMLVFSIVGGLLPFFVADLIHAAYLWMVVSPVMSATDDFFQLFPQGSWNVKWLQILAMYASLIGIHSFYLLGGVLFKKFHFIAVSALLVIVVAGVASLFNMLVTPEKSMHISNTAYSVSVIVFWTLAIVFFTWLAYRLFCRWQVVTHKLANV